MIEIKQEKKLSDNSNENNDIAELASINGSDSVDLSRNNTDL